MVLYVLGGVSVLWRSAPLNLGGVRWIVSWSSTRIRRELAGTLVEQRIHGR